MSDSRAVLTGLLIALLLVPAFVNAGPGDLDPTFGTGGKITTAMGAFDAYARSVTIQPDGKILVVGSGGEAFSSDFTLARYNSAGSLDTTFDADGKVTTAIGSSNDFGMAVALQPDGKIIAAGYSSNGANDDFVVVRYNSNGSLDTSFDGDGKLTTAIGSSNDLAYAIALQADGKIVVVGSSSNGSNNDFALVRYNSDGSLDTTFDADGRLTTAIGTSNDYARAVAIQADGKIVVAGYAGVGDYNDFALARYNSDGSLDTSFDTDGIQTTAFGSYNDNGYCIAIQADGKIVVAGHASDTAGYPDVALARYNADGSLDTSFDTDGKVTAAIGSPFDRGFAVAIQADGKILVAGQSWNGSEYDFALLRYSGDGSLDTSFTGDGIVTTAIGVSNDNGNGMAIQADGKIVVVGDVYGGGIWNFGLVRYEVAETAIETVPNGGSSITLPGVTITNHSGGACTFTVIKYPVPPGGSPAGVGEMPFHWDITSDCSSVNVDLVFLYTDTELLNANGVVEGNLRAFKNTGAGTWTDQCGTYTCTLDTDANSVTVPGVTALSKWTLADGESEPTALVVRGFGASRSAGTLSALAVVMLGVAAVGLAVSRRIRNRRPSNTTQVLVE